MRASRQDHRVNPQDTRNFSFTLLRAKVMGETQRQQRTLERPQLSWTLWSPWLTYGMGDGQQFPRLLRRKNVVCCKQQPTWVAGSTMAVTGDPAPSFHFCTLETRQITEVWPPPKWVSWPQLGSQAVNTPRTAEALMPSPDSSWTLPSGVPLWTIPQCPDAHSRHPCTRPQKHSSLQQQSLRTQ